MILTERELKEWAKNLLVALQRSFSQSSHASLVLFVRLDDGVECPRVVNDHGMPLAGWKCQREHPNYAQFLKGATVATTSPTRAIWNTNCQDANSL